MPQTLGMNGSLERIDEEVDWEKFDTLVEGIYSAEEGRPSYPPLMMVKVLLLEQWYKLSDPQMEEALWDRISFRRFLGLGDDTPHYSTISRFRTELARRGLSKKLFEELVNSDNHLCRFEPSWVGSEAHDVRINRIPTRAKRTSMKPQYRLSM